jgi:uracil-DNA glycosylase
MSFSCPHYDFTSEQCLRLDVPCVPGRPGCVLRGKVDFIDADVARRIAEREERLGRGPTSRPAADADPLALLPAAWRGVLAADATVQAAMAQLATALPSRSTIPASGRLFAALALTPPDQVRVIIVGQDPYPTPGHACGVAFAISADQPELPRSLRNIFAEVQRDTGDLATARDLKSWSQQGVLLLNRWLSLDADLRPAWDALTSACLRTVWRTSAQPIAALLWGRPAAQACSWMGNSDHPPRQVLRASHPSPLSCRRPCGDAPPFLGCGHFSAVNRFLAAHHAPAVRW